MVILLRILLVLLPLVLLIAWIRWRVRTNKGEGLPEKEVKTFKRILFSILAAIIAVGASLKVMDDSSSDVDRVYVPARVENGKLIPGHFVPADEVEDADKKRDKKKEDGTPDEQQNN